jgi:hypothetical protein
MSEQLTAALEVLTSTYQDLDTIARGLVVDAAEVAQALSSTEADSADGVALRVLAKYNPYVAVTRSKVVSDANSEA